MIGSLRLSNTEGERDGVLLHLARDGVEGVDVERTADAVSRQILERSLDNELPISRSPGDLRRELPFGLFALPTVVMMSELTLFPELSTPCPFWKNV